MEVEDLIHMRDETRLTNKTWWRCRLDWEIWPLQEV
jgi:hypothetical protein